MWKSPCIPRRVWRGMRAQGCGRTGPEVVTTLTRYVKQIYDSRRDSRHVRDITFAEPQPPRPMSQMARLESADRGIGRHGCRIRTAGARGSQVRGLQRTPGKRQRSQLAKAIGAEPIQLRDLMNSARRNRSAVQSSSIATCRTVSKPSFFSTAQPVSRLNSQVYLREVPFG